ncbi:hypothetical protein [uncultured Devosia sp.]|uniref:hypothetical protein n=1 Tax=uncultured Devosia sp. TaxID=211434 RepID=UPI0026094561|nr:hypothetical protein [uncultured Devosia sp.]
MRLQILLAAFAATLPLPAIADSSTAEAVAGTFCAAMLDGTPDPTTMVTPALGEMIATALARNADIQATAPDEKPPLGDGIPWSSWPDRPDTCEIELTEAYDGAAMVNITYGFSGAPEASYTDTLVLMEGEAAWAIDDVILADNQTLRGLLTTVFDP